MIIREYLKRNNALTKEIKSIDFHMSLLNMSLEEFKIKVPGLCEKSDKEILDFIVMVYKKCDSLNLEYDSKLDEEMTRLGLKTDVFYGGHSHSIFDEATFLDDLYVDGLQPMNIYDDYLDSEFVARHR